MYVTKFTSYSKNNTTTSRVSHPIACSVDLQGVHFYQCRNVGLSGIRSVRYRNEQYADALVEPLRYRDKGNQSGVPDCSSKGLRYRMPECGCRRHHPRCRCPALHIQYDNSLYSTYTRLPVLPEKTNCGKNYQIFRYFVVFFELYFL
jgi:hypothetical protein